MARFAPSLGERVRSFAPRDTGLDEIAIDDLATSILWSRSSSALPSMISNSTSESLRHVRSRFISGSALRQAADSEVQRSPAGDLPAGLLLQNREILSTLALSLLPSP